MIWIKCFFQLYPDFLETHWIKRTWTWKCSMWETGGGRMLHTWDLPSQVCGFAVHLSWVSIHAVIKTSERTIFLKGLTALINWSHSRVFSPPLYSIYVCINIRTVGSSEPEGEKIVGIEHTVHVALSKLPMNQFKPVQKSRQQAISAYCPIINAVLFHHTVAFFSIHLLRH